MLTKKYTICGAIGEDEMLKNLTVRNMSEGTQQVLINTKDLLILLKIFKEGKII